MTNQIECMTDVKYNLVLEAYANIPFGTPYADVTTSAM
jgi:hypothetical protein